jgi:hypothetical protein
LWWCRRVRTAITDVESVSGAPCLRATSAARALSESGSRTSLATVPRSGSAGTRSSCTHGAIGTGRRVPELPFPDVARRRYGRRRRRLRRARISSRDSATTALNGGLCRCAGVKSRRRRWLVGRSSDGMSSRATRSWAKSSSSRSPGVLSAGASRTATKTSARFLSSWSRADLIESTIAASATIAAASPATPPMTVHSSVNVSASGTNEVSAPRSGNALSRT